MQNNPMQILHAMLAQIPQGRQQDLISELQSNPEFMQFVSNAKANGVTLDKAYGEMGLDFGEASRQVRSIFG